MNEILLMGWHAAPQLACHPPLPLQILLHPRHQGLMLMQDYDWNLPLPQLRLQCLHLDHLSVHQPPRIRLLAPLPSPHLVAHSLEPLSHKYCLRSWDLSHHHILHPLKLRLYSILHLALQLHTTILHFRLPLHRDHHHIILIPLLQQTPLAHRLPRHPLVQQNLLPIPSRSHPQVKESLIHKFIPLDSLLPH